MLNIAIVIEDEKHIELLRSDVNFADILNTVWENTHKNQYPWLWSIDPYGLTQFNLNQISHLNMELKSFSTELNGEGKKTS